MSERFREAKEGLSAVVPRYQPATVEVGADCTGNADPEQPDRVLPDAPVGAGSTNRKEGNSLCRLLLRLPELPRWPVPEDSCLSHPADRTQVGSVKTKTALLLQAMREQEDSVSFVVDNATLKLLYPQDSGASVAEDTRGPGSRNIARRARKPRVHRLEGSMGPFPHDAPKARIDEVNVAGTDGFEFVEFAHPESGMLEDLFARMGYVEVARHRTKDISVFRQGRINYLVNREPGTHAAQFVRDHGPCAPAMAWRVVCARNALQCALDYGAEEYTGTGKSIDAPAVIGIGGSLLYFVEEYDNGRTPYDREFDWLAERDPEPDGAGFHYIDHLTHNVMQGNMDTWYKFYATAFNFREIKFFNIKGRMTGLTSRALTSPCGKIRIPINESSDDRSQIEEYLKEYGGEGIQHIAVGTEDIYRSIDAIAEAGISFMPPPPDVYYERSHDRVRDHEEPVGRMKRHGILIDGEGVVGGGQTRILLQIFSRTVIGPIFFEFIQRKGDDGFGEGNFKALFESIEEDQIRRGVLKVSAGN